MTPERNKKIIDVIKRRQPDLTVVMDDVHKQHNLAAIARTCDAVGITDIHAVSTTFSEIDMSDNAACGCGPWINITVHKCIDDVYTKLREKGFRILATHFCESAESFRAQDFTVPTAIVVGQEVEGISQEAIDKADGSIIIPMVGMVQSLNVSVATAVMLFEAQRQREEAGMYDKSHITGEAFDEMRFEWTYPRIAESCRKQGRPYMSLDEHGEIV